MSPAVWGDSPPNPIKTRGMTTGAQARHAAYLTEHFPMEIIWITAACLAGVTFGLAVMRSRECRRFEVLGRNLENQ